MKITQMKFQKIVVKATFIIAILTVFYALIFATPLADYERVQSNWDTMSVLVTIDESCLLGYQLFANIQPFNRVLFTLTVIDLVATLALFAFFCQKRRKYYLSNYIVIGVVAALNIALAVYALVNVIGFRTEYVAIGDNKHALQSLYEQYNIAIVEYQGKNAVTIDTSVSNPTTWTFELGIILFIAYIISSILLVVNAIWKSIEMKKDAEKYSEIDAQIRENWKKHDMQLIEEAKEIES